MAGKMNLLAIETSTSRASVALSFQGELFVEEEVSIRQHARVLLTMIDTLLASAGIDFQAIDGIVFGEGPGSFTGVRVACSVAKALAYAHDLPLFPVNGLYAIAYGQRQSQRPVLAVIDARMNQLYWAFDPKVGESAKVSSPKEIHIPEDVQVVLAGVAFKPYMDTLPLHVSQALVSQQEVFPEASAMTQIVQAGEIAPVSAEAAKPLYVRDQVTGGMRE
ncbi:MAG: tRNA (adenosine(37)-N6)-threonylcarbamoyltransferase complex dimerization subunit type 1 TsaB [Legionellaceae bacterium]|nr:tRNA (adenosine(37)-N6)-threonylcarbamoyltransferase complex dimerization subunit type 1 TsaB [Legionellaceae bacterium]